jgi:probable phosphoglycerate mutase
MAAVDGHSADGNVDVDVVLVSHGAAIRLAAAALLGDTAETWYVPNTGLVLLRPTPGGWELEDWDTAEPVAKDVTAGGAPD